MSGKDTPFEFFTLDSMVSATGNSRANIEANWPHIAYALDDLGMWDVPTVIAAIATVRVEGGDFAPVREAYWLSEAWRAANLRYYPYYGRGFVQLTWESNYRAAGNAIGIDLVAEPDRALDPSVAAWNLAYYFRDHGVPNMQHLAQDAWLNTWDWRPTRRYVQGALAGFDIYLGVIETLTPLVIESVPPSPPVDHDAMLRAEIEARANSTPFHAVTRKELRRWLSL